MLSTMTGIHLRRIELYENERYIPVQGWSSKSLLLTDRNAISTIDGANGWSNINEASSDFLSYGWNWDLGDNEESKCWSIDKTLSNIDADGWTYSPDFKSLSDVDSGTGQKSMMHFVRRRRLVRNQYFDVNSICNTENFTCEHCDLQEIEKLALILLEKLCSASIIKHPRLINIPKIVNLKRKMIEDLNLNVTDSNKSFQYSFDNVVAVLDSYCSSCNSTLSSVSSALSSESNFMTFSKRIAEISKNYFGIEERNELAKLIIRKYDNNNDYHCLSKNCGMTCIYSVEECPNNNCGVKYSQKWRQQHDEICPQKIINCDRHCGRTVIRKLMSNHLQDECILRPVLCTFSCIGCEADILQRDFSDHIQNCQSDHLELSLKRIIEQQNVITQLFQKTNHLEETCLQLNNTVNSLEVALATVAASLKASEVRQNKNIQDQISRLDNIHSRKITEVQNVVANLNRSVKNVSSK